MIGNENLGSIMGAPVMGPDNDRIGTVGQIFVDPVTGSPNWVTVHTGLFGRHETFVPLDEATWDREVLHIPYEKNLVKDAPRIDTDEALDSGTENELYRYYGLATVEGATERDQGDRDDVGEDTMPQDAPVSGSMRLRKYTVTEEKDVTVPVTHEEVRLEPDPDADASDDEEANGSDRNRKGRHRA